MLDPSWAFTRPVLWLALAALVVLLVLRAIRKDRTEYQRFKRLRVTSARQAMYRKWLRSSFLEFGGIAAVLLLLAAFAIGPLLAAMSSWPGVRELRDITARQPVLVAVVAFVLVAAIVVLTSIGAVAARKDEAVVTVGDIRAMLPRNRQELLLGGLLSVNAGLVEELLFRLALPAAIYGASGSAIAAVVGSLLLFGALHLYQGIPGIVGTTIVGALMMLLYAVSGTIVLPMVVHALVDLRSLVIIPMAVYGAHRVDGRVHPVSAEPRAPSELAADAVLAADAEPAADAVPAAAEPTVTDSSS